MDQFGVLIPCFKFMMRANVILVHLRGVSLNSHFCPRFTLCGILLSRMGIKPMTPAEVWSLNYWVTREVHSNFGLDWRDSDLLSTVLAVA